MEQDKVGSLSRTVAIKRYFEEAGGRRVSFDELKQLTSDDREELSKLAGVELGVEIVTPQGISK